MATTFATTDKEWLDEMARFYGEVFGLERDYSGVQIPTPRDGFGWLLVMDQGVLAQTAINKCRAHTECAVYTDLSLGEAIPINDRDERSGTYAIRLRDDDAGDDIHLGKSYRMLRQEGISTTTLREWVVLKLWYLWKTGVHLDIDRYVLCAGSVRRGEMYVPVVTTGPKYTYPTPELTMIVKWCLQKTASSGHQKPLRCREVVA